MIASVVIRQPGARMLAALVGISLLVSGCAPAVSGPAQGPAPASSRPKGPDPRIGLKAGWEDAGQAIWNLELVSHQPRPQGFFNPTDPGDFNFANTDIAFQGNLAFLGSYNGVQVWDISNPASPRLRTSLVCPGGQGDVSVHENLLFLSVEEPRARLACGAEGVGVGAAPQPFQGVRIFDISNLDRPRQVAAVQTCRGSHTHTLVPPPNDRANLYVYVSGVGPVRQGPVVPECSGGHPDQNPNTAYFRIEVIRVPLAAPQEAKIVSTPRIFADPNTGAPGGLWMGGSHGPGTQNTAPTDQCHDITVYPELGLGAGACSGNGILLDIRDPANPKRIEEVTDPNFAYWHSATFNNDGSKVIYTDEWGGGVAPHCRASDRPEWGANAIFRLNNNQLEHAGYYKLPAPQTEQENCVAHNGSLIPVPGRDIMVQAWYQGGISVFDFTNPERPVEIAFFDRGPLSATETALGGYWSAYWYNGHIYGSEISRGLDIFRLRPSEHLSANEIEAARLVQMERFNPQLQTRLVWPRSVAVARAYLDQLERNQGLPAGRLAQVRVELARLERLPGTEEKRAGLAELVQVLEGEAGASRDASRVRALVASLGSLLEALG